MNTFFIFVVGVVLLREVLGQDEGVDTKLQRQCIRKNEKFTMCGTACPITCNNYDIKNLICTMQCVSGCFCVSPYIRNSEDDCVLPADCKAKEPQKPKCSGANEVYHECGTLCPKTCDTRDLMFKCVAGCQPGCFCASGYLRNKWNKCVLIRNCD